MRIERWLAAGVLILCGCAKDVDESGTRGEYGRVAFNYQRSCFFGCPLEQPLLVGARERITVTGVADDEHVTASSSDEELARFAIERSCFCQRGDDPTGRFEIANGAGCDAPYRKHCDNDVLVEALGEGDPILELRDATGAALDRVPLRVREAAEAEFEATFRDQLGAQPGTSFDLEAGESIELALALYDADGRKLLAPEGVHYRVQDPAVATVTAFLIGGGAELDAGLDTVVQGKAELAVDVPGLRATLAISVLR